MSQYVTLKGHSDSVLCLAFDPKGDYLASSSSDGTVLIWDLRDEPRVIKTINVCGRIPQGSAQLLRLAWHPNGEWLAIPRGATVRVLERDTWEEYAELKGSHTRDVSLVSVSNNVVTCGSFSICLNGVSASG